MDASRARSVARVLWSILGLNVLVAVAKLAYGYRSHAIAITADGLHSLLDGMSNVVGLVGLAVASRPPDANHPYGHRKYETFAALGVAAMLFVGCREILASSLDRLRHPRLPEVDTAGFVVLFVTIAINLFVVIYERRAARRLNSELLLSDAAHTGSDVLASVLVLVSFALAPLRHRWVDLATGLVIVGLILRSGWEILRSTLSTLSDERRIDPALVEAAALEVPGVREAHNVRSRGASDDIHLDLHILVDPGMPIARAHALGHSVEQRLRARWRGLTDVVVHVEPALESERATHSEGGGLKAEG
jgi:cation diffusion facilitator family transporter